MTGRPDAVTCLRLAVGALLVLRPSPAAAALGAPTTGNHPVLRVLGVRQLLQGGLRLRYSSRRARQVGAVVDGLHASTCAALAVASPERRAAGLRDAAIAISFGLAELLPTVVHERSRRSAAGPAVRRRLAGFCGSQAG